MTAQFFDSLNNNALHSEILERQVLASLMTIKDLYDTVANDIHEDIFHFVRHRVIFKAIQNLATTGKQYDAVMVFDWLVSRQLAKEAGGESFIMGLFGNDITLFDLKDHIQSLKDYQVRRNIEAVLQAGLKQIQLNREANIEDTLTSITQDLAHATNTGAKTEDFVDTAHAAYSTMEQIQSLHMHGTPTGFIELDNHIGGIGDGQLVIIAGGSSSGKSILASNIAVQLMNERNQATLFYSMEMPAEQVTLRALCSQSNVPMNVMKSGEWNDMQFARYQRMSNLWAKKPFYIDARGSQTIESIMTKTRRMHREKKGLACIVVDYIQLMHSDSKTSMRSQEVDKITRGLKSLALELNIPVIALSQFKRTSGRPTVADLRESGSIEQDADLILMIHHHENAVCEVVIGKQRQGVRNVGVPLFFNGAMARFENPVGAPLAQGE